METKITDNLMGNPAIAAILQPPRPRYIPDDVAGWWIDTWTFEIIRRDA